MELLEIDVSRSMLKDNLFPRTVDEIAAYIDQAPPCRYLILARFGTTADIVDHGFLTTADARARLKASLRDLSATHGTTNFDEAAKLIEWVQLKLTATYDSAFLSVRVFTDGESSPDPDKIDFSLQRFLQERLATVQLSVMEFALTPSGSSPAEIRTGERYVLFATPVATLRDLLLQTTGAVLPSDSVPSVTAAEALGPRRASLARQDTILLAVAGVLLGVLAVLVTRRRITRPRAVEPKLSGGTNEAVPGVPAGLLVAERELAAEDGTEARVLRRDEWLPIARNAPISFGTDATHCTCVVAPLKDVEAGELFSVTAVRGGLLYVKTVRGAVCNGRPVPPKGLTLTANEPFRVRVGQREWTLTPANDAPGPTASDHLFTRIQPNRQLVNDAVHP